MVSCAQRQWCLASLCSRGPSGTWAQLAAVLETVLCCAPRTTWSWTSLRVHSADSCRLGAAKRDACAGLRLAAPCRMQAKLQELQQQLAAAQEGGRFEAQGMKRKVSTRASACLWGLSLNYWQGKVILAPMSSGSRVSTQSRPVKSLADCKSWFWPNASRSFQLPRADNNNSQRDVADCVACLSQTNVQAEDACCKEVTKEMRKRWKQQLLQFVDKLEWLILNE